MRNVFLILLLANIFLFGWQFWIDPESPSGLAIPDGAPELALYDQRQSGGSSLAAAGQGSVAVPRSQHGVSPDLGTDSKADRSRCVRIGPMLDDAATQQMIRLLAVRGIDAGAITREAQVWLGHGVQIGGFATAELAEGARRRLVAGGLADAYLLQDGEANVVSLGVFREQARADRVVAAARRLGFKVATRDRFRPTVEQWLLVRPMNGRAVALADLNIGEARILRAEDAPCDTPPAAAPDEADAG